MNSNLMTSKQVCAYFQITAMTLQNWRSKGLINSISVGRNIYYRREEVENLAK